MSSSRGDYEEISRVREANPRDLRFTQEFVANRLSAPYGGVYLRHAADAIRKGALNPSDLYRSPLKIFKDENGIMWCENNRRLWVLRKAGVSSVQVKFKSNGFKARCLGKKREMLSDPQFYPKLRAGEIALDDSGRFLNVIGEISRLLSSNSCDAVTVSFVDSVQGTAATRVSIPALLVATFETPITGFAFAALIACFALIIAGFAAIVTGFAFAALVYRVAAWMTSRPEIPDD